MPVVRDTRTIVSGVSSVAKSGGAAITGAVTLSEGANITLTEVGNDIAIAAAGGGGVGTLAFATANIAHADILALPTTAKQILATPGANKVAVPLHAMLRLAWTADYTNIDTNATISIADGTQNALVTLQEVSGGMVNGLLASGESATGWMAPVARAIVGATALNGVTGMLDGDISNKPVNITATNGAAGNFTGGNAANVLTVTLLYYVVSF